tara:strand:- start:530 stop:1174 length:645 start_codon:yes stop_codon:yes gene_type:complete
MFILNKNYNFSDKHLKPCEVIAPTSGQMKYASSIFSYIPGERGAYGRKLYWGWLQYASSLFTGETILDFGTHLGHSAFILGENKKNSVLTYDIVMGDYINKEKRDNIRETFSNINFYIKSCMDISPEVIKKSSLIFLDLDPHDGIKEPQMMQIIRKSGFKGIVLCDDIHCNEEMSTWWNNIPEDKVIVTPSAITGTGVIFFSQAARQLFLPENS